MVPTPSSHLPQGPLQVLWDKKTKRSPTWNTKAETGDGDLCQVEPMNRELEKLRSKDTQLDLGRNRAGGHKTMGISRGGLPAPAPAE